MRQKKNDASFCCRRPQLGSCVKGICYCYSPQLNACKLYCNTKCSGCRRSSHVSHRVGEHVVLPELLLDKDEEHLNTAKENTLPSGPSSIDPARYTARENTSLSGPASIDLARFPRGCTRGFPFPPPSWCLCLFNTRHQVLGKLSLIGLTRSPLHYLDISGQISC